jgi:hypothetical protein
MIYSYKKEYDLYYKEYLDYTIKKDLLLIWCDYESMKTYINYENNNIELDYILTSTNLVLDILKI